MHLDTLKLLAQSFALLALLGEHLLGLGTLGGERLDLLFARLRREIAGEEEVARVAGAHVHHIAHDAEGFDVVSQQKFDVLVHAAVLSPGDPGGVRSRARQQAGTAPTRDLELSCRARLMPRRA